MTPTAAFRRWSVDVVLAIAVTAGASAAVMAMPTDVFGAYNQAMYAEAVRIAAPYAPAWIAGAACVLAVWSGGEFVTMQLHPRRRAWQDLIAGTVVLCDPPARSATWEWA